MKSSKQTCQTFAEMEVQPNLPASQSSPAKSAWRTGVLAVLKVLKAFSQQS